MSVPIGPYSPVLRAGEWVYTAGQLGLAEGKLVPDGVAAEVAQIFTNARGLLALAGATLDQVVKCTVFLTTMDNFAAMNAAYVTEWPAAHRPTRSTVGNVTLALGAHVEIEFTAYIGPGGVVVP